MNATPSFYLPACPMCSSLITLERPFWKSARLTTHRTGNPTYMFSGCKHAVDATNRPKLRDDPAEWSDVESEWATRAIKLFEDRTERWSTEAKAAFRHALDDRPFAVRPEPKYSQPETPAAQQQPTKETHGKEE